jgi:hypothetical protein
MFRKKKPAMVSTATPAGCSIVLPLTSCVGSAVQVENRNHRRRAAVVLECLIEEPTV